MAGESRSQWAADVDVLLRDKMNNGMIKLLDFLCRLEKCQIHYRIEHNRDASIMVMPEVPGQRWEVEFLWMDKSE